MKVDVKYPDEARWWDPLAALLLLCALLTAAGRLVVTDWSEDLSVIQTLTLSGGILGLVLGQTRFSARWVTFFALAYAVFVIPWQLGLTISGDILWQDRLLILSNRVILVVDDLIRKRPLTDNLLFILLMSIMFWILSLHAGYSLTRYGQAWRAALPTGLSLLIIHSYDPLVLRRVWFLAAYLLFALLMVARLAYSRQRFSWKLNRTYVPPDIGFDWIRFTLVVAVFLIFFAWTVPAVAETLPAAEEAWMQIKQPWDQLENKVSNWFSGLKATVGVFNEYYGDNFTLSRGNTLNDNLVMEVDAPAREVPGMRYYWRAYTYDHYEGGKWTSTIQEKELFHPENPDSLALPEYDGRLTAAFSFRPKYPISTIITAPQPIWVSERANAIIGRMEDGTVDLIALQALPAIRTDDQYQVRASVTAVTAVQLREAGTEYPAWIREHYLQIPGEITSRTLELALEIKGEHDNPYDIAVAVTEYLRTYPYQETIDEPPRNQELLDWWLFEYGKGFCQYYASAEVILLRALGIPARWSVGYAEGEFIGRTLAGGPGEDIANPEDPSQRGGTYLVRARDSHTWPEVYFPGIGWVEFEPTAGQAAIVRPSGEQLDLGAVDPAERLDEEELERERLENLARQQTAAGALAAQTANRSILLYGAFVFGVGLVLAVVIWQRKGKAIFEIAPLPVRLERSLRKLGIKPPAFLRRWAYLASLPPLMHSYMEINRALRRLGKAPEINATPTERAEALAKMLPVIAPSVKTLLAEYQYSIYSQQPANLDAARQAGLEIRNQSLRALARSLISGRVEALPT